ncbi:MAG: tetratricopeptide repeat protein [Desulfobacterales bacterium]|nr:tetratricopeptide repeat protein [Desulfobacterales bacterium]
MSGRIQKIFQFAYLSGLALSLAGLLSGPGCSKGVLEKRAVLEKTWTCDKAADDTMKRQDYKAAIPLHQRFLENEPANALALYHLGYAYGQTGNHVGEVSYYEKAIALGFKEDGIFFNLGMAYGELNQTEESIDAFKKALDINPDSADNHFGLAIAYQMSVADKLAEKEFLKALEIDPAHVDARLHLSLLYTDMGQLQKACEHLRKILEIDPTHRGAREFLERIEKE